jgi:hypothetical protein
MARQDMAFLEDQLDEQASACWKQRKWSIAAEKKKKEEEEAIAIAKAKRDRANGKLAHSVGITWAQPSAAGWGL